MKKCPFCAEEIQDEAIKCRFCGSFLSAAPGTSATPPAGAPVVATPAPEPAPAPAPAPAPGTAAPFAKAVGTVAKDDGQHATSKREMLYDGSPSWKTYFGHFVLAGIGALIIIAIANWANGSGASLKAKFLAVVIPLAALAVFYFGLNLYRRSIRFRVSNTVIEYERGMLSKRIDVVQLWRIKDVVYRQSLADRILSIAHIHVLTSDAANPNFQIVGMPASRKLFEQLRDSIEIQRQAKNVYGVVS